MGAYLKARIPFPALDATVKVDNLLSVRDGNGEQFVVYSYLAKEPSLSADGARLGLWALSKAFPNIEREQFRILDVLRGRTFAADRTPLAGDEELEFGARYARLIRERDRLLRDYE